MNLKPELYNDNSRFACLLCSSFVKVDQIEEKLAEEVWKYGHCFMTFHEFADLQGRGPSCRLVPGSSRLLLSPRIRSLVIDCVYKHTLHTLHNNRLWTSKPSHQIYLPTSEHMEQCIFSAMTDLRGVRLKMAGP